MSHHPRGWARVKLEDVVDILDSRRVPVNRAERAKRLGSVPYYGATGQVGWIDEALFDEDLLLLGEDGVPFLDPTKHKSYIVRGPSWVNNHAHVLRAFRSVTSNRFLMYYLNQFEYIDFVNGTTRLKLTQKSMRNIPVALPGVEEQGRIVEGIEKIFSRLDVVESTLTSLLDKLEVLRSAILTDAFHTNRDLPADWRSVAVGDICFSVEKTDPRNSPDRAFEYIDIGGIGRGTGKIVETRSLLGANAPSRARQVVKVGDIVLSTVRTYQKKTAIVPVTLDNAIASTGFSVLRPVSDVDPMFLLFQVLSHEFVTLLNGKQTGTSYPAVRDKDVRAMPFRIAPLEEQKRIVVEMEARFSFLDAIKTLLTDGLNRIAILRQSVLAEAFAGRLVPQDPKDEPASALLERVAKSRPAKPARRKVRA